MAKYIELDIDYKNITPFTVKEPKELAYPIVVSSPHSGRLMPGDFAKKSRLDMLSLRRSEDAYVNELISDLVDKNIIVLEAEVSRSFVDVNRSKNEIDKNMFVDAVPLRKIIDSNKLQNGLGVIPSRVGPSLDIYDAKLLYKNERKRIKYIYEPYHNELKRQIDKCVDRFGCCLVLDIHSMPEKACRDLGCEVDVVIGDIYGNSCPQVAVEIYSGCLRANFSVEYNNPYAGGFITANYTAPKKHIFTLQTEIRRSLYMDEGELARLPNFNRVADGLCFAICELGEYLLEYSDKLARF